MRKLAVLLNAFWILILVYNIKDFVNVGLNGTMLELGFFGILYVLLLLTLLLNLYVIFARKFSRQSGLQDRVDGSQ